MIKIEEKKVKVLFAKGENGTIAIGVKDGSVTFQPIIDYVEVGTENLPDKIIGEKLVELEFGNVDSIDVLIKALYIAKRNMLIANNPIPLAC